MTQVPPTAWPTASASEVPLRNRVLGGLARSAFSVINRRIEWHRLPLRLSLLNLDAFRHVLRLHNLIDTEVGEAPPQGAAGAARRPSPRMCGWRAAMTAPSTISPRQRWARSARPSAAI